LFCCILPHLIHYAKENGYDAISTTLLVSPYQNHEVLKQMGEEIAKKYGFDKLKDIAKLNFKNTEKIKNGLN